MSTTTETHPLRASLQSAIKIAESAKDTWLDCDHDTDDLCEHNLASDAADAAVEKACEALLDSDCPRGYLLRDDGGSEETIEATSLDDAEKQAEAWVRGGDWDTSDDACHVQVRIWLDDPDFGDRDDVARTITVTIDQEEPECSHADGHDWQSPHELVGGLEENPGVHGHGGGVIVEEVCMRCGCGRTTDTWAQNRSTGEQGLTEVTYEEDAYDVSEREDDAAE